MEHTRAPTDPNTLDAAFKDHAHRTDGACHDSRRFNPVGNGIPITNPSGAIRVTAIEIFTAIGNPTPAGRSTDTITASSVAITAISPRVLTRRRSSSPTNPRLA